MGNNHNSSRKVSKKDLFVSQMVGTSKRELAKTVLQGYQIDTNELFIRNDRKVTQLYKMEKEPIGKGAYGEVWKGKHTKTDAPRAIKKLNRNGIGSISKKEVFNEIQTLKELDHPNIVKTFEYFETKDHFYLVTEFLQGSELLKRLTKDNFDYSEVNICRIMKQILYAIKFMHDRGVMHGDVKSENIIFDGTNAVLIDFGHSQKLKNKKGKKVIGTNMYLAPEVIKGNYTEKCDIWSVGVIFYIMLTGQAPFSGSNGEVYENILNVNLSMNLEVSRFISQEAIELLNQMFIIDYKKRPSAGELLKHPWFQNAETTDKMDIMSSLQKIISNMSNFRFKNKLKEIIYCMIVHKVIERKYYKEAIFIFDFIDKDKKGVLMPEDIMRACTKVGRNLSKEELNDFINAIDLSQSGYISFGEFLVAAVDHTIVLSEKHVYKIFNLMDLDSNGKLSLDEFNFQLQNHKKINSKDWKALLRVNGIKNDIDISFEDFKRLSLRSLSKSRLKSI